MDLQRLSALTTRWPPSPGLPLPVITVVGDHIADRNKEPVWSGGPSAQGYKLLEAMGYRRGQALGQSKGLTEPLELKLKSGRKGLGIEEGRADARKQREAEHEHVGAGM